MFDNVSRRDLLRGSLSVAAGALAAGAAGRVRPAAAGEAPAGAAKAGPHIGLCTYMVGAKMDLATLIDACEKGGMEGVELRTTHAHGVEPSLDAAGREKVKAAFAKTKVKLVALGTVCEFHAAEPATVQKNIDSAREFIKLAADLGAWGIKVRPNGLRKDVPEEQCLKQIGEGIREVAEFGKEKGIVVVMEMHGGGTSLPARCAKIMEACNHPSAGLCWNSNGDEVKDGSIKESWALVGKWVRHAHVKDLGKGFPFDELVRLMKAAGFTGYCMLETSTTGDPVAFLKERRAIWDKLTA
jgi:sugar phosphate isomerase/epimerase